MGTLHRKAREKKLLRERRIAEILKAAKTVFHAKGFSEVTIEDIAREAELSPGTLYIYFKSKYDIYALMNITILEDLDERLNTLYNNRGMKNIDKLKALGSTYLEVYEHDPVMLTNIFHIQSSDLLSTLSPEALSEIKKLTSRTVKTGAKIVRDSIREGAIGDYHPVAIVDLIWGIFTGLVLWEKSKHFFDPKKNYLKETLKMGFDILYRGMENKTPKKLSHEK